MKAYVTGDDQLDKFLLEFETKTARQAMRSGLRAGNNVIKKAIQKETSIKSVRDSIGSIVVQKKNGEIISKVGAGVGKSTGLGAAKKEIAAGVNRPEGKKGVGMSARNIHWYVLGTAQRRTKSGRNTGRMPANGIVKAGWSKCRSAAMKALQDKTAQMLNRVSWGTRKGKGK